MRSFTLSGRGLHIGRRATVTVSAAGDDEGIVFLRVRDSTTVERIPALWKHAVQRPLCTALAVENGPALLTVEHILAALSALRIDNALVTVEGDELPIFDGSAMPWCAAILAAGRREQASPRRHIRLLRTVEVAREHRLLRLDPSDRLTIDVGIVLGGFGSLNWTGEVTPERFVSEVAPARSFGRLKWALPLKLYSLFKRQPVLRGANFGTTAVLWGDRVVGGMPVPDEPVRHRALDLIGDLSLAGLPIVAPVLDPARGGGRRADRGRGADAERQRTARPDRRSAPPLRLGHVLDSVHRRGTRTTRLAMVGVARRWRGTPTGRLAIRVLLAEALNQARASGAAESEISWMLETNRAVLALAAEIGAKPTKCWRVYERSINPGQG